MLPEPGRVGSMRTSAGQGQGGPVTFCERYGFKRPGDFHGNEICSGWRSPSTRRATVRRHSLRNETNELERRLRERLNVLGPAPAPSCFTSCCFPTSSRWTDLQGHAAVASVTTEPEAERHAVAFTGLQRTVVCWFKREVRGDRGPWFERQR
jgi:hypothetical protein